MVQTVGLRYETSQRNACNRIRSAMKRLVHSERGPTGRFEIPVNTRLSMSYTFAKTQNCPQVRRSNGSKNEIVEAFLHRIFGSCNVTSFTSITRSMRMGP